MISDRVPDYNEQIFATLLLTEMHVKTFGWKEQFPLELFSRCMCNPMYFYRPPTKCVCPGEGGVPGPRSFQGWRLGGIPGSRSFPEGCIFTEVGTQE